MSIEREEQAILTQSELTTALALDRTLLAWVRTALTLTAFGFTLARVVHDFIASGVLHGVPPSYPRQLGFALMALGVVSLIGGAFEYIQIGKQIGSKGRIWSSAFLLTVTITIVSGWLTVGLMIELSGQ